MILPDRLEQPRAHVLTEEGVEQAQRIATLVVARAGVRVETIARTSPFTIKPRKGQFVVFDKPASRLIAIFVALRWRR